MILLFLLVLPIREVTEFEPIVNDVQSQLQAGHGFGCDNPISTVHECTHGINSRLRNIYKKPCFYVLNNKMIISESSGTLKDVADSVPPRFRGSLYQFYLVDAQKWWNNQPTYVFDELSAYLNALEAREELGITNRKEISGYVSEFIIYSSYVKGNKDYLNYQIKRADKLEVQLNIKLLKERGYYVPKRSESLVY